MLFESVKYDLTNVLCQLDDAVSFDYTSDAAGVLDLIILNLNRVYSGVWVRGVCSITPIFNLRIENENCLSFLVRACLLYVVEFEIQTIGTLNYIHIRDKIGIFNGLTYQIGRGLFSVQHNHIDVSALCTRLYARGGSTNVPDGYGSTRLQVPIIEQNVALYGIREVVQVWDDIYPHYTGVVESCAGVTFIDTAISFDINTQLIPGVVAKITFLTGELTGYAFDIVAFSNSAKEVTLKSLVNDINITLPNSAYAIQIGDTYKITDIYMPNSYVLAAETALNERAEAYIAKYSEPLLEYTFTIDFQYAEEYSLIPIVGEEIDYVHASGTTRLRVFSIEETVVNQYKYTLKLTDVVQLSRLSAILFEQYNTDMYLSGLRKKIKILTNN